MVNTKNNNAASRKKIVKWIAIIILLPLISLWLTLKSVVVNYTDMIFEKEQKSSPEPVSNMDIREINSFLAGNFLLINLNNKMRIQATLDSSLRNRYLHELPPKSIVEITDRKKLLNLFAILKQDTGLYNKIVCDLEFGAGYSQISDSTDIDCALGNLIKDLGSCGKLIIPTPSPKNLNDCFPSSQDYMAPTNYHKVGGAFLYEQLTYNGQKTLPYKMFEEINQIKIQENFSEGILPTGIYKTEINSANSPLQPINGKLMFSKFIPYSIITINDYYKLKAFNDTLDSTVVTVGIEDILKYPFILKQFLNTKNHKKSIFIGYFSDNVNDYHTVIQKAGASSGALLILSSYYSLYIGNNKIKPGLFTVIFFSFLITFLIIILWDILFWENKLAINVQNSKYQFIKKHGAKALHILSEVGIHFLPVLLIIIIPWYSEHFYHNSMRIYSLTSWILAFIIIIRLIFKPSKHTT